MAILHGYTIPAQFNKNWDHVYVGSDGGHLWGCFGGDSGGIEICSGPGDIAFAYCLSYPRGKSALGLLPLYAGITYGKDGVCHQAANRILYPVGQWRVACHTGKRIWSFANALRAIWPRWDAVARTCEVC
jgi:hypothetical protein